MGVRVGNARLSTFLRQSKGPILSEWDAFARTLTEDSSTDIAALREHAATMLDEIAADIDAPQSAAEQADKSKGLRHDIRRHGSRAIAAAAYGHDVAAAGFSVLDVMAEFRALRASVTQLWATQSSQFGRDELEDLVRFNESIDEIIAFAIERYADDVDETRHRFLAILGHDLRNPLTAVGTAASVLSEAGQLAEQQATLVGMIQGATKRMARLVADMLALAGGLGNGMMMNRSAANMGDLVKAALAEIRVSYPRAKIEVTSDGSLAGRWDGSRLTQALTNLIANAIQHGDGTRPVHVSMHGGTTDVSVTVQNSGPPIPRDRLRHLFGAPRGRRSADGDEPHLGLGLFIVNKIVEGHDGMIDVQSSPETTAFTMRLPRAAQATRDSRRRASSAPARRRHEYRT
jgi:hypothetical protein